MFLPCSATLNYHLYIKVSGHVDPSAVQASQGRSVLIRDRKKSNLKSETFHIHLFGLALGKLLIFFILYPAHKKCLALH